MANIQTSKHYRLNYIITFTKLIKMGEFDNIDTKIIDKESIGKSLLETGTVDYLLFLTEEILLTDLWYVSDSIQDTVASYLNKLYKIGTIINNDYIVGSDHELLFNNMKLPMIMYKSSIHSKKKIIVSIITDGINKDKALTDEDYKKKIIDTSNMLMDTCFDIFHKNGITDQSLSNINTQEEQLSIMSSFFEIEESIKDKITKGKVKVDILSEMGVSLIEKYKSTPELKNNKYFIAVLIVFIKIVDQKKKASGGIIPVYLEKLYKLFVTIKKENLSDSDGEVEKLANKFHKLMIGGQKQTFKYIKK